MTIIFEEYVETKIRFVPLATKIHKNQGLIFNDNSRQFGVVNFVNSMIVFTRSSKSSMPGRGLKVNN